MSEILEEIIQFSLDNRFSYSLFVKSVKIEKMKTVFFICCLTFFAFAAVRGQKREKIAAVITNVILPCAIESGFKDSDISTIKNGDLSSITSIFGCFSDCTAEKAGMMSDGAFQVDAFQGKISKFVNADHAKEVIDECVGKAGTEKCQVTGPILQCFLGSALAYIYS